MKKSVFRLEKKVISLSQAPGLLGYLKLCSPVMLFPILFFPYKLWIMKPFSVFAQTVLMEHASDSIKLLFTGNNTILLFWCAVTLIVMVAAIVLSAKYVRPWYIIFLYLAVMFSLCGIFSLLLYKQLVG